MMKVWIVAIGIGLAAWDFTAPAFANPKCEHAFATFRTEDRQTVRRVFEKCADAGHAVGQAGLGFLYMYGLGVEKSPNKAVKWFNLAVQQGNVFAFHGLGTLYAKGEGVPQDYVYAYMWFNLSVARGGNQSGKLRKAKELVAAHMTRAQIAEAQRLARECVQKEYKGC